jgi:hypothetical protein
LTVRPTEDGSVILENEFYGKTASPRLHLSESHLDTLGLCYFLALRKTEAKADPTFKLLILDDVLHSVDADHRVKVAQLLKQEFNDHQLIITTHDDIFFGRLRTAFGNAGIEYRRFHGWDIVLGPASVEKTSDLDTVCDSALRMNTSVEDLAAASGRFFEWTLRELTERLEVAIQARFSRNHDIGSLWPPLSKKLRANKGFINSYPKLCEDIELHGWVRNLIGAHYNEFSSGVTPAEVRDFAILLENLYRATFCVSCGGFVRKQSEDEIRCANGCIVYHRNLPANTSASMAIPA